MARLRGRSVAGVRRHGKFIIVDLDDDVLVGHLRMSGQLRINTPTDAVVLHTHVVVDLDDGSQLRFIDPRTFGELFVDEVDADGRPWALRGLGPDALARMTDAVFHARLVGGRRTSTVKAAVLDQTTVAGVGNIYADEALFAARIAPHRPAASITGDEATRLRREMRRVLRAAINARGSTFKDGAYLDAFGNPGGFALHHKVYARAGLPCLACGTPIQRVVIAQRGTHFCPSCQV